MQNEKFLCVITQSQDITLLNGSLWEQLICKSLSLLEIFYLKYLEYIDDDSIFPRYTGELNEFTSSFLIERKQIFECYHWCWRYYLFDLSLQVE